MKIPQLGFIEDDTITTPPSGIVYIYAKSDGLMYQKDDTGVETQLGGGGGGSGTVLSVASANGDLTVVNGTTNAVITAVESPASRGLKSATTTVSVSGATAPTAGQVLTATNSTTATWQTPTGAGTGPAFRADRTTNQLFTAGVGAIIVYDTEVFDTNNCYNPANGRFTPNVAGYYSLQARINTNSAAQQAFAELRKNGSFESTMAIMSFPGGASSDITATGTALVFANGTTDYFEIFMDYTNSGGSGTTGYGGDGCFSGFLAR